MERWMRRRAAVGEGRWTMQKGDWKKGVLEKRGYC
jgi:hypothetical protein